MIANPGYYGDMLEGAGEDDDGDDQLDDQLDDPIDGEKEETANPSRARPDPEASLGEIKSNKVHVTKRDVSPSRVVRLVATEPPNPSPVARLASSRRRLASASAALLSAWARAAAPSP